MQALWEAGDQAALTQVYRDLRLLLHRDLNTDPAPETEALYRTLLARALPSCPWRRKRLPDHCAACRIKVRAEALNHAALLACHRVDYAAAQSHYEESLAIQRELGDEAGIAEALTALGLVKHEQGDHATALTYLEEILAMQQEAGERQNSANTIYWLGCIAEEQGDLEKARLYLEEAHTIDLEFGQRAGHAQWKLGDVLCMQGDYAAAHTLLSESLKTARELGDKVVAISGLECLAWLVHSQGASGRHTCMEQRMSCAPPRVILSPSRTRPSTM